jgi:hypothetical protein
MIAGLAAIAGVAVGLQAKEEPTIRIRPGLAG